MRARYDGWDYALAFAMGGILTLPYLLVIACIMRDLS
mgnify:CR=1 FL=1